MINYMNKFRLDDKKAVVTGGAGLLGKQIVIALAQAGAKVFIADINHQASQELMNDLSENNYDIDYVEFDITDIENIEKNVVNLFQNQNGIDIWINNAYPRTTDWGAKLEDISISYSL